MQGPARGGRAGGRSAAEGAAGGADRGGRPGAPRHGDARGPAPAAGARRRGTRDPAGEGERGRRDHQPGPPQGGDQARVRPGQRAGARGEREQRRAEGRSRGGGRARRPMPRRESFIPSGGRLLVDRAQLERFLEEGLSLAEIGRRVGRHESTVGVLAGEARARGGQPASGISRRGRWIARELEDLVQRGFSIAQIAPRRGAQQGDGQALAARVRTADDRLAAATRPPRDRTPGSLDAVARVTGWSSSRIERTGATRCVRCRAEAVTRRRRKVKRTLVAEAGGACRLCGYGRCLAALEFHHVAPADKRFTLSRRGMPRSLERARAEARKCVLLCANCHAEVEAGVAVLPGADRPAVE